MYRDKQTGQYLLTIEDLNLLCCSYGIDPSSVYIYIRLYYDGFEYRFLDINSSEEKLRYSSYTGHVSRNETEISAVPILGITGMAEE